MLSNYSGGEQAKAGFYMNRASWEVTTLSGEGGQLPGGRDAQYVRVPTLALLVFAPLMGAAYAMFLPFIGIAMVTAHVGRRVGAAVRDTTQSVMTATGPAWQPGEAHLAGSPKDVAKSAETPAEGALDARLQKLEDEIAQREQGDRR